MIKKILIFSFVFFFVLAGLIRLDRFFFKKNHSFSLRHVLITHPELLSSNQIISLDPAFLEQPYVYLSKGKQSFVFESSDHQYVLKIYRLHSMLRPFPWMNHPWDFFFNFSEKRQHGVTDFQNYTASIKNCYLDLKENCGLLGVHFGSHLQTQKIHLIDKMGQSYFLRTNEVIFTVQKKADLFFSALEPALHSKDFSKAQHLLRDLIQVFRNCYEKGYEDRDSVIDKNYGVANGKVIIIDVGQVLPLDSKISLKDYLIKKTDSVKSKLERDCPDLLEYYWSLIEKNT